MTNVSVLNVMLYGQPIGTLTNVGGDRTIFAFNEDYVEAAKLAGASHVHILFRELLPNCISAIAVKVSLDAGFVILFGASLSFLGLGIRPPTPDLGTMVATGSEYMPEMWWQAVMPGLAILFATLGFNLLGDGLRDMMDVEV